MADKHRTPLFRNQKRLFLAGLEEYAEAHSSSPPKCLQQVEHHSQTLGALSMMLADRSVGRLLTFLTRAIRPRIAVDIGTFTGYSALCIAEGLTLGSKVITCEVEPLYARIAQSHFERSPYKDLIELRTGPAQETIAKIDGSIGLAFIDADKLEYWDYYNVLLERLAPNGLIVIDNTLLLGSVLLEEDELCELISGFQASRRAVADFNKRLQCDPRTENSLLIVGDGITMVMPRRRTD